MRFRKGFTLVEVITSLAVFGLIMTAMTAAFYKSYQDWIRQRNYLRSIDVARWAIETVGNELRIGESDTISNNTADFNNVITTGRGLYFEFDSNHNGNPDKKIFYWLGNGNTTEGALYTLYRSQVAHNKNFNDAKVSSLREEVAYGLVNNTNIFSISDSGTDNASVSIVLTVRPQPDKPVGAGNREYIFRTLVRPRS